MQTDALRSLVKTAATATRDARLWPNGLGFDCHGTQYVYLEACGLWAASRRVLLYGTEATKYGTGKTPMEAKRAAGIGRKR